MRRGQGTQPVRAGRPTEHGRSRGLAGRRFRDTFIAALAIDPRSLSLFRAGLGLVVIADLLMRSRNLFAHYTDQGVLPRGTVDSFASPWDFSLHLCMGTPLWQVLLFLVAIGAAVAFAAGHRPRTAALVSWILAVSLQNRNPLVVHSGDVLLRMMLLWCCFLPEPRDRRVTGIAAAALLLQTGFVYWFAALNKTGPEWHGEGTAVYFALHIDQFVTPLGRWVRELPAGTLRALTRGVWLWEWAGAFLLFAPAPYRWLRLVAIGGFALMHLSFELLLGIGVFPFINLVSLLPFLPPELWDRLTARRPGILRATRDLRERIADQLERIARLRQHRAGGIAAGCLLAYVFLWNLVTVPGIDLDVPPVSRLPARALRLDQRWSMFAPAPIRDDGWYVLAGKLENGRPADLARGTETEVSWEKPPLVSATYPEERWQKYLMNLSQEKYARFRTDYARWLCGRWNAEALPGRRLKQVDVFFVRERTTLAGKEKAGTAQLVTHACF